MKSWLHWYSLITENKLSASRPLSGVNVLVTRPAHQASNLANKISATGGNPILFPVLEITDAEDLRPMLKIIDRLASFDLAIFVSPNAVNRAMVLIQANQGLPAHLKVAVVGKGSADALKHFGVNQVIVPAGRYDSEALLDRKELQQMKGKRVIIFRGNGGRKLLGDTLVERGAILEYVACYCRGKPTIDATVLLTNWAHNPLNAVTITSSEGLCNLLEMVGKSDQQLLKISPLFTAHQRIAQLASEFGFATVVTTKAGDEGLLQGLIDYFQAARNKRG
jgi:uroporphyrinogen-III synthase